MELNEDHWALDPLYPKYTKRETEQELVPNNKEPLTLWEEVFLFEALRKSPGRRQILASFTGEGLIILSYSQMWRPQAARLNSLQQVLQLGPLLQYWTRQDNRTDSAPLANQINLCEGCIASIALRCKRCMASTPLLHRLHRKAMQ